MQDVTAGAPKFALLVGINKYKNHPDVKNLDGAHNDVGLIKSFLVEYGFKEDLASPANEFSPCGDQKPTSGIRTLCSQQATKKAILDTFDSHLLKNAEAYWKGKTPDPSKGPAIFFYYSGHGGQVEDKITIDGEKETDLRIDEADGLDETLVAHDSDSSGARDIRDDSFEERMNQLKRFTSNITFMSDSCHSGTITRGGGMKGIERSFPKLNVPSSGTRGGGDGRDNMFADDGYVTISGSLPTQFSFERRLPNPETKQIQLNGLLTYHFVTQARLNPGASYREIISLVRNAITAAGETQTPQVEGDVDRPVLGAEGKPAKRALGVKCKIVEENTVCSTEQKKVDYDGSVFNVRKIELDAGEIVGARTGGSIVVYAPNSKELTGDAGKIASGTITFADAFGSEAEVVLADAKATDLPPLSRVVLVSPSFRDTKRVVAVDPSASAVAATLRESSYLIPIEESSLLAKLNETSAPAARTWDLAIVRATYGDFKVGLDRRKGLGSKNTETPSTQAGYFIADRSGIALYGLWIPADASDAGERLRRALESHVKLENIRAMSNEASDLKDKLKIEIVRFKSIRQAGSSCELTPFSTAEKAAFGSGLPRIARSEAYHVEITNTSSRALMIYILSLDSSGAISLLYPPRNARESLDPNSKLATNLGNPCYTYAFDTDAPVGLETIKIIASERPIDIDLLTQTGIKGSQRGGTPLEKLLAQAGSNTRGPRPFNGSVADWAAINVDYVVVP